MIKYLSTIALLMAAPAIAQNATDAKESNIQEASYISDQQLFIEFKSVCSDISSLDVIQGIALKNNWLPYQAPNNSIHAKSLALLAPQFAPNDLEVLNFARKIAGKNIILSLSHVKTAEDNIISCRIYDYEANQAINPKVITSNLKQEPTTITDNESLTAWAWMPGININHFRLQSIYVSPESSLVKEVYLKGVILIAQQQKDSIK